MSDLGTIHGAIELDLSQLRAAVSGAASAMQSVEQAITKAGAVTDNVGAQMTEAMQATAQAMQLTVDAAGRWRNAAGQFASASEMAAAGLRQTTQATQQTGQAAQRARFDLAALMEAFGQLGTKISQSREQLKQVGQQLTETGMAMSAGLTVPLGAVAALGLRFDAMSEQAQVAFTKMLGSGAEATAFLTQLKDFAAATPFEFPELQDSAKRLLGMGFAAKDIVPMLTDVGDAVAGVGGSKEVLDGVILALGQMQAKGKVSAEEMNQFAERGIPAWRYLAAAIGTDIPTAMKKAEAGAISADVAITAIREGMRQQFGGMMAEQSKTLLGVLSTIKDVGTQLAGTALMPAFTALRDGLQAVASALPAIQAAFAAIPGPVLAAGTAFAAVLAVAGPVVLALGSLAVAAAMISAPVLGITLAVGAAAAALAALATSGDTLRPLFDFISTYAVPALDLMAGATIAWAIANAGQAAIAAAIITQRIIIATAAAWANVTAMAASAAAALAAAAPWIVLAAAIASVIYLWQKYQSLAADVAQKWADQNPTMQAATAALKRYNEASSETRTKLADQADQLQRLQAAQADDLAQRATLWDTGQAESAAYAENTARINERTAAIKKATAALAGTNLSTVDMLGTLFGGLQQTGVAAFTAITVVGEKMFAAPRAQALAAAGDIDGALAILRASANLTADEMKKLADEAQKAAEAGAAAFAAATSAEVGFLEDRATAASDHSATLEKIESDRQSAITKATEDYGKKRAGVEEDFSKKRLGIESDFGQKRADLVASYADTVAALELKKADQLIVDMKAAQTEGLSALGDVTNADVQFVQDAAKRRKDYTGTLQGIERDKIDKLTTLARDYHAKLATITGENVDAQRRTATRDYEQKRADLLKASADKTNTERASFAEGEAQAALAYAKEQAQQSEHLGRMLIQYTMAQGLMKGISKDRIEAMTGALADEYGVQTTMTERSFGKMRDVVDAWAKDGGASTAQYTQQLGGLREEAAKSQLALDQLIQQRTAAAQADFTGGRIGMDEYLKRLQAIPKTARTELGITTTGTQIDDSKVGIGQANIDNEAAKAKQDHYKALAKLGADYTKQMSDAATARNAALKKLEDDYQNTTLADIAQAAKDKAKVEDDAYAASELKAAQAYAKEQAAQRAHLGQMLINYTRSVAQDGKGGFLIDPKQIGEMTDKIAAQYGVQQSAAERGWAASARTIQEWVANGGKDTDSYITKLSGIDAQAAITQKQVNAKIKAMTDQAKLDLDAGKLTIEQYTTKLATIPTEAEKVVKALKKLPTTITLDVNSGGAARTGRGVEARALGGPVTPNRMYEVAEGGVPELLAIAGRTYLLMGAQAGTVIPAMQAAQASMAGQGVTMRQAVALTPRAPGVEAQPAARGGGITFAPQITIHNPVVDSDARVGQLRRTIQDVTEQHLTAAIRSMLLGGV